jgi:hypothetical protein
MPDLNALEVLVADAQGAIVSADIAVAGANAAFVEADLAGRNLQTPMAQLAEARAIAARARAALTVAQGRFDAARRAAEAGARAERFERVREVAERIKGTLCVDVPKPESELYGIARAQREVVHEAIKHLQDWQVATRVRGGLVLVQPPGESSVGSAASGHAVALSGAA